MVNRVTGLLYGALINMFEVPVAVVSSLGGTGLNIIYPGAGYENEATGDMALLGHEAELHYHVLEPIAAQNPQLAISQELKQIQRRRKNNKTDLSQVWKKIRVLHTRCI